LVEAFISSGDALREVIGESKLDAIGVEEPSGERDARSLQGSVVQVVTSCVTGREWIGGE
jgi:hypothetical protein